MAPERTPNAKTEDRTEDRDDIDPYYKKLFATALVILVVGWLGVWCISSSLGDPINGSALQGGPVFWSMVENKLHRLADAPDIPPVRKKKIVEGLKKLSVKYRLYVEALTDAQPASGKTD